MSGTSPANSYLTTDDGVRLYYETWESGAKTLIIPNGICLMDDFPRLTAGRSVVAYDLRNRGRSDTVSDGEKLERGILNDVGDLEAIRQHLRAERVDLIGHSYLGLVVILYAMKYPQHVSRVVQIGAPPPRADAQYPAHLTCADGLVPEVFQKIGELSKEMPSGDSVELCRRFWELLRVIYVFDAKNAARVNWMRCELANERNFMAHWTAQILPSIQRIQFAADDFARVTAPVLTIHGNKDRSTPYGGAREWALRLPHARLLTVPNAAHAPWIEAPETVLGSIESFLNGRLPEGTEKVTVLDPGCET
jgi:pimeloyl-ACP methyl ester carboxylesterase